MLENYDQTGGIHPKGYPAGVIKLGETIHDPKKKDFRFSYLHPHRSLRDGEYFFRRFVLPSPRVSALGKWTNIQATIDCNRVIFKVGGKLIESRPLPQPFKARTHKPLLIGGPGANPASTDVPHKRLKGEIRKLIIQRGSVN